MLDKTDGSAPPDDVVTAQRRVHRAVCALAPPAAFHVLTEQFAQEMVAHGIVPGTAAFESFLQTQIGGLVQRGRGLCDELGGAR